MRFSPSLLAALALALVLGAVAALVARAGLRHDPRQDDVVTVALDRVEHTITLPPDHNARATYGVDPILHARRRNEIELRRRLDFNRPRLQDALQGTLSRYHYSSLQKNDAKDELATELRDTVNGILGGDLVEAVTVVKNASR
jgi:hypothetical protein